MYNIGGNAKSLKLLSLGLERKIWCYNGYFINRYVFYIEDYKKDRNTYNNGVCVKESIFNEFEVDYYGKLEKKSFNYHIIEHKIHKIQLFLFKCY